MFRKTLFLILSLLLTHHVTKVESARILFYFGVGTYSHRIVIWPLVEELSKSHSVTFLSASPPKSAHHHPNVTEYVPSALATLVDKARGSKSNIIQRRMDKNFLTLWLEIQELGYATCEAVMNDPEYTNWIKTQEKFDLIIIDGLFNDCGYGIVHYQKTDFIVFDSTHPFPWQYDILGYPAETSWISELMLAFPHDMSYWQRIVNTLGPLYWHFTREFLVYPKIESAINKGLVLDKDNEIDIREVEKRTRLVLVNSHFSVDLARSLPPLIVPVGGLHITKKLAQDVPKDIQEFMESSGEKGFIYISFGSGAQISKVDVEIQRKFFYALGNWSDVRFLWKWEGETLPSEMPPNVLTAKWMPQAEILSNPNIRAFMTHAGLLSIMEAVVEGVPLILLPIFAEQHYNARRAEAMGYGIALELVGIKQEEIQKAIGDILKDNRYKEKMMEVSAIFQDRQNKPLDTAVWWIEYMLRHKSNQLMTPMGIHQSWFVRRHLDVWLLLFGFLSAIFGGLVLLVRKLFTKSNKRNGRSDGVKSTKKRN